MENKEVIQIVRFLFWGCVNTGAGFLVYCLFVFLGAHIFIASFLSLVFGIFLGHFLNKNNVFKNKNSNTIYRYIGLWVCLYGVNISILHFLVSAGYGEYISGAIAAVILVPFSYVFQRLFVFR